ncbi:MAG: hypothetical protein ACREKI_06915 [Gemmatimonadota bacterium]
MKRPSKVPRQATVILIAAMLSGAWPPGAFAQTSGARLSIYVTHEGRDAVGRALAYSLREEIRKSAGYELVASPERAAVAVHLASVDATPVGGGATASALSVTYTRWGGPSDSEPLYVASEVLLVTGAELEWVARSILAALEDRTSGLLASWSRAVAQVPALCRPDSRNPFLAFACDSRVDADGDRLAQPIEAQRAPEALTVFAPCRRVERQTTGLALVACGVF